MSAAQQQPTEQELDDIIKTISAMGYLLWLIDDIEIKHKVYFRQSIKRHGNLFKDELLRVTNQMYIRTFDDIDSSEVADQQVRNYYLVERLHQVAMIANRKLSPEEQTRLHFSLQNVLYSFGINVSLAIELED